MKIDDLVMVADTVRKLDRLSDFVASELTEIKENVKKVNAENIILKQENLKFKKLLKIQTEYSASSQV